MRAALKYGIPLAGGLAAGGYALSQGEEPGSAVLAGLAGGAGAAGGLLGGRLAGKYAPDIAAVAQKKAVIPIGNIIGDIGRKVPAESNVRNKAVGKAADIIAAAESAAVGPGAQRMVGKLTAGLGVPVSAGAAGLGGIALGTIPASMGVPGFQQQTVDPESYGSSNSAGARYKAPTMQYV
jgi:hypothetical protein